VVSVREPWSRLRSLYLDQFMHGYERRSLAVALGHELDSGSVSHVIERADRDLSRRYLATSLFGPYVARLCDGPLGAIVGLVSAETLDDDATTQALGAWIDLTIPEPTEHANTAPKRSTAMPAVVHRSAALVSRRLPGWMHRRLAPAAKPVMERLASVPLPDRRRPDLTIDTALRARIDELLAVSNAQLASISADRWLGPRPDWVTG